jgi:hypothetical protein
MASNGCNIENTTGPPLYWFLKEENCAYPVVFEGIMVDQIPWYFSVVFFLVEISVSCIT